MNDGQWWSAVTCPGLDPRPFGCAILSYSASGRPIYCYITHTNSLIKHHVEFDLPISGVDSFIENREKAKRWRKSPRTAIKKWTLQPINWVGLFVEYDRGSFFATSFRHRWHALFTYYECHSDTSRSFCFIGSTRKQKDNSLFSLSLARSLVVSASQYWAVTYAGCRCVRKVTQPGP